MIVAVKIGPDGGVGVEILAAMDVLQHGSPALRDNDWLYLQPVLHLGEGMPDKLMVEFREAMHLDLRLRNGDLRFAPLPGRELIR